MYRDEQLDEIEEIRLRLAKNKINIDNGCLQKGLLIPQDVRDEKKLLDLPHAGLGLLENPFFKSKKKKKKKKSKGKKK